ncbi:MAG: F0F1 ATP synthase subunit B' [Acetobacteraceae bacterium]|nr:F0F1 ATP synthase subunit B' [Acetobacteraceae bacterium]
MPQLDFSNPLTTSQVVWGAVIFLALYFIFASWGLPLVGSVLAERDAKINGDLEAAREAKGRADAAVTELTDATHKARAEAQAALNAAVEQAKKESAERSQALNERLEQQLQEAEHRIADARKAALGALRQVATDTATLVVSRLTGHTPDAQAIESAVGAALVARGQG